MIFKVRGRVSHLLTFWGLLLALLLPLYGPWLDPTFAARQPYHSHIYLGEVDANHHHPTSQHDHQSEEENNCISTLGRVINVPDQILSQQLLLLWQPALAATILPSDHGLSIRWQADGRRIAAIFLPPPDQPPRF